MPGIVVMGPEDDGVGGKPDDEDNEENPIFSATLDEQRRVYGQNVLPHRASKSLLPSIGQEAEYVRKPQPRLVIHHYDAHWYVACTASLAIWFLFTIQQKSLCKL